MNMFEADETRRGFLPRSVATMADAIFNRREAMRHPMHQLASMSRV